MINNHRPRPRFIHRAQQKKKPSVNIVNVFVLLLIAFCVIVCMFFLWRHAAGASDRQEQRAIERSHRLNR